MTTEANDTPTTEGRWRCICDGPGLVNHECPQHTRAGEKLQQARDTITTLDAEITELKAQLNRAIESSSIAESGRLNAEAALRGWLDRWNDAGPMTGLPAELLERTQSILKVYDP